MPLRFTDVCYGYGRKRVIDGLSMELEDGEWLAIVGANGAGRSTLAEMAVGLRRPLAGHIIFDGHDIWSREGRKLRKRLGLVMQRAEDQFLGQTVYEDMAFGPRQMFTDSGRIDRSVRQALEAVDFELDEVETRPPLEFSGGQRRRLAVAGILALDPTVLVLDEPFAGLDGQAREDMSKLLSRLRQRGRMSIVTMTSDIELVSDASRMALLVNGAIGLTGDIRDFVANQRLCREAGISLPERIRLALGLRERGWKVPVFGPAGALEAAVADEWRERKHA